MKLRNDMMEALRGRRGLELDDTSQDREILSMGARKTVAEVAAWRLGDPGWGESFYRWYQQVGIIEEKP